jgi:long-chain fatty acid transport protein
MNRFIALTLLALSILNRPTKRKKMNALRMPRLAIFVSLAGIFAWAGPVSAGGLYIFEFGHPLQGASNAGEGAIAQDASTAATNPAGIMMLDESEWMVTGIGIYSKVEFQQQAGTTVSGNDGGDAGSFAPGASLFYAKPFSEKFGFGFAFNVLSGATIDYADGFVGRYWAEEVDLLIAAAMPSLAWRINDQWSVSVGIPMAFGTLEMDVAIPPLIGMGPDGQARISDGNDYVFNISAGVLWELSNQSRLGLTYTGEMEFEFDSDLEITLPVGGGTTLPQVSADISIPLVQMLRLSGSSDIGDQLTLLATVAWEDWSSFDSVLINTSAGRSGALPRDWDDTWHFALGMRWRTGGPWTFHAGVGYDTDPTDASKRTADMPIDRQIRLSGGATYTFAGGSSLGGVLTFADYGDARIDNGGSWGQVVGEYDTNRILFMGINYSW